ncbi:MAG TPA: lysophospholipid acyltransferase family protein [Acetobacteraceae bacterium]|nr:lysophospholipid acyltransferase family protein [Acetobacteraceae bacterium]
MQASPRRLKAKRNPLLRRKNGRVDDGSWPGRVSSFSRVVARRGRAVRRAVMVMLWTLLSILVQSVCLVLPGRPKIWFARIYWAGICGLIGLKRRVIGRSAARPGGRPVVFVSNHSSWLDIAVLGAQLDACFIAKDEVSHWPVINVVAKLGRTVFVRRQRSTAGRERDDMRDRLAAGDNLVLFPEGTTSDGSRVLPFRSAFFSIAEVPVDPDGLPPLVQPVSVVYDRLGYLPAGRATRALFAWYGDMDIGSHFWRLAQYRGLRATVLLHVPVDPRNFAGRKPLAEAVWTSVAEGAATLRQNRPVRPLQPGSSPEDATRPAFA